ncbi:hypothetical protein [Komarekiella delphini-convector]|nr:hypothetical protein [Komarekiella delphini-convector]
MMDVILSLHGFSLYEAIARAIQAVLGITHCCCDRLWQVITPSPLHIKAA